MGQAHLATGLPGPAHGTFGPRPRQGSPEARDGGTDSGMWQRAEVGPWVREMAGEVGDSIWSLAKEEAHQRAVSTGAWLRQRGTAVRGGIRWWRWVARGSGRWSGYERSLRRCRQSASVAKGSQAVVGDGKARVGGRGVGAVRRREEEPEWEGIPPLQPHAVDKGARGGTRGRRLRWSSGRWHMAE
jgi:hypothetical protein